MQKIINPILPEDIRVSIGEQPVENSNAFDIQTYYDLVEKVAKISYLNKDYLLFFRGQRNDHLNKAGASTFYPTIYRGEHLSNDDVSQKFKILNKAADILITLLSKNGFNYNKEVKRRRYIQWSILQHYEVCDTPLLDLTHSLHVACSIAQLENTSKYGYVFVFGMPYLSNRISINSEQEIVIIRLLSICPPDALRPYFQEGYLVGTEDITTEYESKTELDFKSRLIAKFRIPNTEDFWTKEFSKVPQAVLKPREDKIAVLCDKIKVELSKYNQIIQISVGNKQNIWGVNNRGKVFEWTGVSWDIIPGRLNHISVGSDSTVWGVTNADKIYRRDKNSWTLIKGKLKQISVGSSENVWGVSQAGRIYKWSGSSWDRIDGILKHVSVGSDGTVWGVTNDDKIYRRDKNSWTLINGKLKQISVGNAKNVWGVSQAGSIYKWSGSSWDRKDGILHYISVGNDGYICGIYNEDVIFKGLQ